MPVMPEETGESLGEHVVKIAGRGFAFIGLGCAAIALLPWPETIGRFLEGVMATSIGTAALLLGGLHWRARRPIYNKGPIFHEERSVAYHVVFAFGLVFAVALVLGGVASFARSL